MELKTKNGYSLYDIASALQKSIRRGDIKLAGFCALEMFHSGFSKYLWKRLYTVSAEDCYGLITHEIKALCDGFLFVNEGRKDILEKGRIFISKAVILLCMVSKNRDSDHLQNLIFDKNKIDFNKLDKLINNDEKIKLPEYTYDCHTAKGKRKGKTKKDFFVDEYLGLKNKQLGFFDQEIDLLRAS